MKKLFCVILTAIMIFVAFAPLSVQGLDIGDSKQVLSTMSEQECIAFLKSQGVKIPDDYEDELVWGPFVKRIIANVEEEPECIFSYNYSVTQEFAEAIRTVVNEYYGVSKKYSNPVLNNAYTNQTRASLRESTVITSWIEEFTYYKCYGYAIDLIAKMNPGFTQENSGFSLSMAIGSMANLVVEDLQNLGYSNVEADSTMPDVNNLCTNEHIICIRKGTEDFHFMKYTAGEWRHKPGLSQILRYNRVPNNLIVWTNEGAQYDVVYSGNITYDSMIYYISYGAQHTNSYEHQYSSSLGDTHTLCCGTCDKVFANPVKCTYVAGSNICKVCRTPKTLVINSVEGEALLSNAEGKMTARD